MRRLGGLVLVPLLTLVPAAPAAADDPYDVPDQATITVEGDGSGHGKGLSQYGAYGAARAPYHLSGEQILDFYYPGTQRGTDNGPISVWITRDDGRFLTVDDRTKLMVRAGTGRLMKAHALHPKADRWRIRPTAEGGKVEFHQGRWRPFQSFRGAPSFYAGGAPLTLRTPDGRVDYRGDLRSVTYGGDRITVNVLSLDQYVRGVVPAEVSSIWPLEAMRAQAVASRTYAVHERGDRPSTRPYDLCDTAACQAYGGASAETAKSNQAVTSTAREILTFGGEVAFAQYSASNGGYTVDGGEPYLPAQPDPYEGTSADYYGWTVTITAKQVENAYNLENLTYLGIETRDGQGPRGGRVQVVRIKTEGGFDGTVTGDSFRRNFGLYSTLFEITKVS